MGEQGPPVIGTLRLASPYLGAVVRSLLGMLGAAALALLLLSPTAAMWAAGAAAIAGAISLQDSPFRRIPTVIAVSVASGFAVLVGALTTGHAPLFAAAIAGWCLAAGMCWTLGPDAGLMAAAVSLLLVVAPLVAPSVSAALATAALAIGAGCVQAGLIAAWPPPPWRTQRAAMATAFASLGADAKRLAAEPGGHIDVTPLRELRDTFDSHHGPESTAQRDSYRLPERIAVTLSELRRTGADEEGQVGQAVAEAGDALQAIAESGRGGRRRARGALDRLDHAVSAVSGALSATATRLSHQVHGAAALRFGQLNRRDLRSGLAAIRAEFTWTSPVFRHALRVAFGAGLGAVGARFGDLEQGHWLALTVLLVLRPETAHTYTRCGGRIAGTVGGVVAATAVTAFFRPEGLLAAAVAALLLALTYAATRYGFVAVSAALAATVVFLIDIAGAADGVRIADATFAVLLGGALALMAHVVLPDDGLVRLRQRAGELLKTEIDYAATVVSAFVHDMDRPAEALAAAWQRASRARAAFEAASGVRRVDSKELRRWLRLYRAAVNAVTGACAALETNLPSHPSTALNPEFVAAVDDYIEALRGNPPSPAATWTVDTAALTAAHQRVRAVAADLPRHDSEARMLVGELATITRSVLSIAASREPTSAE